MARFIGDVSGKVIEICLPSAPAVNQVLVIDPAIATKATLAKITDDHVAAAANINGSKLLADSVTAAVSAALSSVLFGAGSDGAQTFDGSATILGMAPVSN